MSQTKEVPTWEELVDRVGSSVWNVVETIDPPTAHAWAETILAQSGLTPEILEDARAGKEARMLLEGFRESLRAEWVRLQSESIVAAVWFDGWARKVDAALAQQGEEEGA